MWQDARKPLSRRALSALRRLSRAIGTVSTLLRKQAQSKTASVPRQRCDFPANRIMSQDRPARGCTPLYARGRCQVTWWEAVSFVAQGFFAQPFR